MLKILAIDDINDNLITLKAILADALPQSIVFTAPNGARGIELAIQNNPDVILLDIIMPGMDGFEVCRQLKMDERVRDIPVVFLTALKGDKENRIKALNVGAEGFLTKPIDETELLAQVKAMAKIKEAIEFKRDEKERLKKEVEERTKALQKSEQQLRGIFENLQDAYFQADLKGRFSVVSPSAVKMYGFQNEEELIGQPAEMLYFNASDREAMLTVLRSSGGIEDFVCQAKKKDGSSFWVSMNVQLLRGDDGQITGTEGVVRDISDRKQAEDALRESELFFKESQRAAFIGSYRFNIINDNWTASEVLEQIFGIEPDYEKSLQGWLDITHPEDREIMASYFAEEVVGKRQSFNKEYRIVRKTDGEIRWVLGLGKLNFDSDNRVVEMLGTIQDVTERRKADDALRESEERYRRMVDLLPDAIIIHEQGKIVFANQAAAVLSGNETFEQMIGQSVIDFVHPDSRAFALERIRNVYQTGEPTGFAEEKFITGKNEIRYGEVIGIPVSYEGRPAIQTIIRDVTDRKKTEEDIFRNEERFQQVAECSGTWIWEVDALGLYTYVNEYEETILGYSPEEVIGKKYFYDFFPPEIREETREQAFEVFKQKESFSNFENIAVHKDGHRVILETVGFPILDPEGNLLGYRGADKDISERKRAEEALRKSEEKMSSIFRVAPAGIGIVINRMLIDVNPRISEMTGYTKDELIGQSSRIFYHTEEDFEYVGKEKYRQIAEKGTGVVETRWKKKDGTIIDIILSSTPLDSADHSKGVIFTALDITERKMAERALHQSEERYRRFISQVSEGVFRFEMDVPMDISMPVEEQIDYLYDHSFIAECNNAFVKMYGASGEQEMIGKSQLDFHDDRYNKSNREIMRSFVMDGYRIENGVTEELTKHGHKVFFSNNSIGIVENNQLVRIWGTQTDVTDRMVAEQVQQVLYSISNAALSAIDLPELIEFISKEIGKLLDSTNFYIAFYDEKNDMLSTLYERDEKDEINSWSAKDSITGYVVKNRESVLIKGQDAPAFYQQTGIRPMGTPARVWLGVPLEINNKAIGALVVQSYDDPEAYTEKDKQMLEFVSHQISMSIERKKAEAEIIAAKEKAEESDRLKSAFLANMSHEIRTPLNSIIGFSELMCDEEFDPSQQIEFSRMINNSGNNLLSIITDIMDLSKIEAGQVQIKNGPVSVLGLVRDIHKEYSFMAMKKGLAFTIDRNFPTKEVVIESDESMLRKVLVNFVGNAIKFTKEGNIEIGLQLNKDEVRFHVKDTGIGIPPEHHHTIFERFRQIESFTTRKHGGNGLGLAISKSLVELLGGTIGMESEPGIGSTFYFTVPKK